MSSALYVRRDDRKKRILDGRTRLRSPGRLGAFEVGVSRDRHLLQQSDSPLESKGIKTLSMDASSACSLRSGPKYSSALKVYLDELLFGS